MTKKELVETVADKLNITYESAENAVLVTMAAITVGLANTGTVVIPNFGTFTVRKRKARAGRNPRTGEKITVEAKNVVTFKAGKATLEAIAD